MTDSIHLHICMSGCTENHVTMRKRSSAYVDPVKLFPRPWRFCFWVSSTERGGHTASSLAFFLIRFLIRPSGQRCASHSLFPYGGGSMQPHNSPPLSSSQVLLGQSAPTQGSSTTPAKKENTETHNLIFTPMHSSIGLQFRFDTVRWGTVRWESWQTGWPPGSKGKYSNTRDWMFAVTLHYALAWISMTDSHKCSSSLVWETQFHS